MSWKRGPCTGSITGKQRYEILVKAVSLYTGAKIKREQYCNEGLLAEQSRHYTTISKAER